MLERRRDALNIKIVTDSTCDLPESVVQDLGVTVIPGYVTLDGKNYLDGQEISRTEFYQRLAGSQPPATTSAPGTGAFLKEYHRLMEAGATGIISIHVAKKLSNISNVALLAAEEVKEVPVVNVDSGQLTLGLGLLVVEAAQAARAGGSLAEITALLQDLIPRTYSYARLDTLDYLRRSGRMSGLGHSLASLLNVRPILKMNNGQPHMEPVRTRGKAVARVLELTRQLGPLQKLAATFSGEVDTAAFEEELRPYRELAAPGQPVMVNELAPVIGVHVGPGGFCVSVIAERPLPAAHRLSEMADMIRSFAR